MNQALQILQERGFLQQCTDLEGLSRLMDEGPISCYEGTDPTGPSLHIGHMVPFFAMRHLKSAGHRIVVLLGGGTARIGDPSGKTEMRKMLSGDQIDANAESMGLQISRFLDDSTGSIVRRNNREWLLGLNYIDFLREIGIHFSVNRMLTFEAYKKRMETGLTFIEFNYQLLQSYDFLQLLERENCRLQIGGDDQWGNIVAGIDLIRRVKKTEAYGLTFPLITTADGKKMGKTEKGALFLDPALCSPHDFFQYWRNIQDADVEKFLLLFTFLPVSECKALGAKKDAAINESKERLAWEVTALIHGPEEADKAMAAARAAFGKAASGKENIPGLSITNDELSIGLRLADLLVRLGACSSKSEARRLIQQGGLSLKDLRIEDPEYVLNLESWEKYSDAEGSIFLKAGKKKIFCLNRNS